MEMKSVVYAWPNIFRILETPSLEAGKLYVGQKSQSTDCEASKLWNVRSGDKAAILCIFIMKRSMYRNP